MESRVWRLFLSSINMFSKQFQKISIIKVMWRFLPNAYFVNNEQVLHGFQMAWWTYISRNQFYNLQFHTCGQDSKWCIYICDYCSDDVKLKTCLSIIKLVETSDDACLIPEHEYRICQGERRCTWAGIFRWKLVTNSVICVTHQVTRNEENRCMAELLCLCTNM